MLSLAIVCVVCCGAKWSREKVNALFVEFLIPDIDNRFFILFGRFLSRGINHPYV